MIMNQENLLPYPFAYQRRKTRMVKVGDVAIGGDNPIRIQSMLGSLNSDIEGCLEEIRKLDQAGCEIIRLTVPNRKELDAIYKIKEGMKKEGIERPLVADIHFSPALALDACELFEKIRINPGNFSDSPKNKSGKAGSSSFEEGFLHLKETVQPFILKLKEYKRALRIGVNQGSLSTRMIEQYGDSPLGMVESAVETIQLFEEEGFYDIVVSLKSSNPLVVQQAYRLLASRLPAEDSVPFHLGVTEAGDGLMGRIKSAAGMGPLLKDGLGDTIRVSLTEPSHQEIPVAEALVHSILEESTSSAFGKRFQELGKHREMNGTIQIDSLKLGGGSPLKLGHLKGKNSFWQKAEVETDFCFQIQSNEIRIENQTFSCHIVEPGIVENVPESDVIIFKAPFSLFEIRKFYETGLSKKSIVMLQLENTVPAANDDFTQDIELAGLLGEGLVDALLLPEEYEKSNLTRFLSLLQATRSRLFTADYISCPSCGRTLFDLQSTVAKIKEKTSHLKGVKIGIMGCVVNGPGEMADADVGYVGSGPGKIDLYLGQQKVKRGVPEAEAVDALVDLLKEQGMWRDQA